LGGGSVDQWPKIIQSFHDHMQIGGGCKLLSAAVWSTGAMQPREGDKFRGMNISGLVEKGSYLNWLNVMAYDCGPPSQIDPLGCFYTYRVYYPGPLCMGMEVGKMGWGGYLTTKDDVKKAAAYVANDPRGSQNGFFIWSYYKDDFANGVTHDYIIKEFRGTVLKDGTVHGGEFLECPWCGNMVTLKKLGK